MPNYHELREQLGGDNGPPWFVIHRGETILALCIRADMNPNIFSDPAEVWVGGDGNLPLWGERLAKLTDPVSLYVAIYPGDYEDKGTYDVSPREHTLEELAAAQQQVPHSLSRIVWLELVT